MEMVKKEGGLPVFDTDVPTPPFFLFIYFYFFFFYC